MAMRKRKSNKSFWAVRLPDVLSLVGALIIVHLLSGCNDSKKVSTAIQGTVVSETGKPMPGVAVILDGTAFQTVTNKSGKFTVSGFPEGTYTVVAIKPGYLAATHYNIEITKQQRKAQTNLTLKPDPAYVPDSLKIVNASPLPETVLTPGRDTVVRFEVNYTLSSDSYATIAVSYQDERGNALMPMPSHVTVTAQKGTAKFAQNLRVPPRFNGKVLVIVAMFPGGAGETKAVDMVTYYVRPFPDQLQFSEITPAMGNVYEPGREVTASVTVSYVLKSIERGEIRLQIRGDLGTDRYEVVLHETSRKVDRSKGETGDATFETKFTIPQNVTAIRARADLVPENTKEPMIIQWSKRYPVGRDAGQP